MGNRDSDSFVRLVSNQISSPSAERWNRWLDFYCCMNAERNLLFLFCYVKERYSISRMWDEAWPKVSNILSPPSFENVFWSLLGSLDVWQWRCSEFDSRRLFSHSLSVLWNLSLRCVRASRILWYWKPIIVRYVTYTSVIWKNWNPVLKQWEGTFQ